MAELPTVMSTALPEVWHAAQQAGVTASGPPFTRYLAMAPDSVEFECGVPTPAPVAASGRARPIELSGGSIVVGWHVGPYDTIGATYEAMIRWIGEQGRSVRGPMWEVYWTDPQTNPAPATWRTEILIPVT
jgi:effector-binding domain-containing protein